MFSKNETNDSQKPNHTVLEELTAQGDSPRDDLRKNLIKTGAYALIHLF